VFFGTIDLHRFLLKFTGQDQEINLLGDGTEKAEFGEWSWVSPEEIIDRVSINDGDNFFVLVQGQLRRDTVDNI